MNVYSRRCAKGQTTSPCQLVYLMTVVDCGLWVAVDKELVSTVCLCVCVEEKE